MALISLQDISFTYAHPQLLDGISLDIEKGQHIGLLGRNGTGKSTLMKILAGELEPEGGTVQRTAGLRVARLTQDVPDGGDETVAEIAAQIAATGLANQTSHFDGVHDHRVERTLTQMNLDGWAPFSTLSSGMKRRTLLAGTLCAEPDILLLDEPTNHLDIESIAWLEGFLKSRTTTLLFVTHDRMFLAALATRILEIDRGRLFDWSCDYPTFLKRKDAELEAEGKKNAQFDKKLAQEEVWIRKGIRARRTRNEGRVRALEKMREDRRTRRDQIGNVRLRVGEGEKSGRLVLEAKNIGFSYGDEPIVKDFSLLVTRGEKIGIIGKNGSGKTTLLKLLLGELEPQTGSIRHGARIEMIYFDQLREQIEEEKTVAENVGEGQDILEIQGVRKHIHGYLQDFLFTPERARQPAKLLSGGERNRLLLARLFKRSSNIMVLDEPTNDLDVETLELLEELVVNYTGTLLLVSHDRSFLNNVVTSTLALEGEGELKQYFGGYDETIKQREAARAKKAPPRKKGKGKGKGKTQEAAGAKKPNLNFKDKQELEAIPGRIETLEVEQRELHATMGGASFFKQDGATIARITSRLEEVDQTLKILYARWEELEALL